MRPTDAAGFREGWDVVEQLWAQTVDRASGVDPELLHESVDGEWSFIETFRHLAFATDAWVRRAVLGDPSPWSPLDLPWDQMPDTPGIPRDRDVRPSLDEVLNLRADRMGTVRRMVDELTDERLEELTEPVPGRVGPSPAAIPSATACSSSSTRSGSTASTPSATSTSSRQARRPRSYPGPMRLEFSGDLWFWKGPSPFHFITVPDDECVELRGGRRRW